MFCFLHSKTSQVRCFIYPDSFRGNFFLLTDQCGRCRAREVHCPYFSARTYVGTTRLASMSVSLNVADLEGGCFCCAQKQFFSSVSIHVHTDVGCVQANYDKWLFDFIIYSECVSHTDKIPLGIPCFLGDNGGWTTKMCMVLLTDWISLVWYFALVLCKVQIWETHSSFTSFLRRFKLRAQPLPFRWCF